jgi:hypothetical protein
VCDAGVIEGEQATSSSPSDIAFWWVRGRGDVTAWVCLTEHRVVHRPMHPTVERLYQHKKLMGQLTDESWPDSSLSLYGDTCSGQEATDTVQVTDIFKDGDSFTNAGYMEYIDPTSTNLPYVYDNFEWPHCEEAGYSFSTGVTKADAGVGHNDEEDDNGSWAW